jgi:predicted RNA-binding protein YlxR (DUF448 family)
VAPKSELIRVAVAGAGESDRSRAVIDHAALLPGRGAYLCRGAQVTEPLAACLAAATRRGGLARALRAPVTLSVEPIELASP